MGEKERNMEPPKGVSKGSEVATESAEARVAATHKCLNALAAAWRGDWSDFDGRTLRGQLGEVGAVLDGGMTAQAFCELNNICPNGCGWLQYCRCIPADSGGSR